MSETIVLYVTRDGHSRSLALDVGSRLGTEVREIGDLVNRKGPFGWLNSGRQAAMGRATPIGDPGVELKGIGTVVLVQPVWASSVCPPVRSWIKAHASELTGKRLALLASGYGTPASVLRSKFDAEFGCAPGKLFACAAVPQKEDEAARRKRVDDFVAELGRE